LKIYIDTPWLTLYVEREPMEKGKFQLMWAAILTCVLALVMLTFFWIFK